MVKDYYSTLGITKKATDSEIKKAYRNLAKTYHPDRWENASQKEKIEAENKFKEISIAYNVLSNPSKRREYDENHSSHKKGKKSSSKNTSSKEMEREDIYNEFMQGSPFNSFFNPKNKENKDDEGNFKRKVSNTFDNFFNPKKRR